MGRSKINTTDETKSLQEKVASNIGKLVAAGLTQQELAETLELYQPEISQFYRKKRIVTEDRFKEINSILEELISKNINPAEQFSNSNGEVENLIEPENNFGTWLYDQLTELGVSTADFSRESSLSYRTINLIINGTTTNPQFRTKKIIQETLDKLSNGNGKTIEKAPSPNQEEDRLFIGLPFTQDEIDQAPNLIGVYAIHDRRGYPTYIGKGQIKDRLKDHRTRIDYASNKVASTFSYLIIQKGDDDEAKKEADREAKLMEKILTKFAGNTLLLNIQNREDLSFPEKS